MMMKLKKLMIVALFIFVLGFNYLAYGDEIQTAFEKSGYETYTTYEEMMDFLQSIQASTTEMLLGSFGTSIEGREQPYAIFSRPMITQPWEAIWSGKPIVLINANVHGGEKTLRESTLIFIRELTTKDSEMYKLLDQTIVIVVPSINVDGFGNSTRGNVRNIDMNRDYMKLEQPELKNFVQNIVLTWRPHLALDCHNGGSWPYNITYQANSHATPDQRITNFCDFEIFPFVDRKLKEEGYKSFYYSGGDSTRWRGGGYDPRINRNYSAFLGNVGILLESPRQEQKTGVLCGVEMFKAVLEFVANNKERLFEIVNRARRETIEMGQYTSGEIPVQMKYGPEDWKVSYELAIGPRNDRKIANITGADIVKKPIVTKSRKRPYAYILEQKAIKSIDMLKRHKVTIEVLQEEMEIPVEAYKMDSVKHRSEYDHPAAVTVFLSDTTIVKSHKFQKGSYVIRTGQVMGRVISHLLEPETNDNVVRWNAMDAILPRIRRPSARFRRSNRPARIPEIPIYKVMTPRPLPTKLLNYE